MNRILILYILFLFLIVPLLYAGGGKKKEPEEQAPPPSEVEEQFPPPPVEIEVKPEVKEEKKGVLKGRIVDESKNPLKGLNVILIDKKGKIVGQTTTDDEGYYKFEGLDPGNYTIQVNSQGMEGAVEISLGKEEQKRAPIPTGLKVYEVGMDVPHRSVVRVQWDRMKGVISYRCEIFRRGDREPLIRYPDILQNFCEFGNLEEDTEYQVRVYSKNEQGYSTSYALGIVKTINKPPLSPYGLGITMAKNNRVDLFWQEVMEKDLKGYYIQVKKQSGPYLYYSPHGLTERRENAFLIQGKGENLLAYSISGTGKDNLPILENTVQYTFRVISVDQKGLVSPPSSSVNVMLEDTSPPSPPEEISYSFIGEDRLKISWKAKDRDIARYRLCYGTSKDRWDGVVYTEKNYYELIIDRNYIRDEELFISVTAIDRAGNESGFKPVSREISVQKGEVSEEIVLSTKNIYKNLSLAIREPVKKEKPKPVKKVKPKPPPPTEYSYEYLQKKGFEVKKGETALIEGKIAIPENTIIKVQSGGKIVIRDAELYPQKGIWGGVRFLEGSSGLIERVTVSDAAVGIAVLSNEGGVTLKRVEVKGCSDRGIYIKDSNVQMSLITLIKNEIGLFTENSSITVSNALVSENNKGILAGGYNSKFVDSQFEKNKSYGLRLYGGGSVENCTFKENLVGVVLEEGRGDILIFRSNIFHNTMDGMVISTIAEIRKNSISNNGRHGIYIQTGANPLIVENDILSNQGYAVIGGGKVVRCFIAYNNGSPYIDDTGEKGKPDNVFSSSSSGLIKQIADTDYINELTLSSVIH